MDQAGAGAVRLPLETLSSACAGHEGSLESAENSRGLIV